MVRSTSPESCASIKRRTGRTASRSRTCCAAAFAHGGKIRHETLGNVSALPAAALEALRASLAGETLVVAGGVGVHPCAVPWTPGRGLGHGQDVGSGRAVGTAVQRARHRLRVDPRPGRAPPSEAGHDQVVERHHLGGRSRVLGDRHRRGLRGHGLVGGTSRGHRDQTGPAPSRRRGQSVSPGLLRPVVVVGGGDQERVGRPGLLA